MFRVLPVLLVIALTLYAFFDCVTSRSDDVRWLPKGGWAIAILLMPVIGPALWFLVGRPETGRGDGGGGGGGGEPPRRPLAPDDDPEFLRQLQSIDEEHERMLRQWERDLRRREERLKGDEPPGRGGNPRTEKPTPTDPGEDDDPSLR